VNPLSILHGSLSEGLHDETDEECLNSAKNIREVIIFLVNQISLHRESSKRFTDSMRKLLEKKGGKKAKPNNGMHPTRDTKALIKFNLLGGRVMPGVIRRAIKRMLKARL
jgi:hypothetical protein